MVRSPRDLHTHVTHQTAAVMGNFENVPELTGTENYYKWRRQTKCLLLGEDVYNHVSDGTDTLDFIKYTSTMPKPTITGTHHILRKRRFKPGLKTMG